MRSPEALLVWFALGNLFFALVLWALTRLEQWVEQE